jgi:hypothetical protein
MSTYNKGDRVRVTEIGGCSCLAVGTEGVVAENASKHPWVCFDNDCDERSGPDDACHAVAEVRLTPARQFQVGDLVRLSSVGGCYSFWDEAASALGLSTWKLRERPDITHTFRVLGRLADKDVWGLQDTVTGQQYLGDSRYTTRATDEPQVPNQGEPTMNDNTILSNAVKALRSQPSDDAILLRKAGLEREDGTPTDQAQTALLEELWQGRRGAYASKLRIAIKAEQAAEAGETSESK